MPTSDPVPDRKKLLRDLRKVSTQLDTLPAKRADLIVAARLLDPPVPTSAIAEACGVTLGAISQVLRREEEARDLASGALSAVRAGRPAADPPTGD